MSSATILIGDVRKRLAEIPDQTIQCCVTSPPYWGLRDYGQDGQIGLEQTPDEYVSEMVEVFREVWRVMRDDGVLWLNLGDSYASFRDSKVSPDSLRNGDGTKVSHAANRNPANLKSAGLKHKDLAGIPWRVALALQADGWYLRQDIIWHKPNPMPESVKDRCTKSHEYLFMLTKFAQYFFDNKAIQEPTQITNKKKEHQQTELLGQNKRNRRSVWTINTKPFRGAHFAVMPEAVVEPCVMASSRPDDLVLDPFTGSGTVGVVALRHSRNFVGVELNPDYAEIARNRIKSSQPMFNEVIVEMSETE